MSVSKAELKRIKDRVSTIENRLSALLVDFKETYYADYLAWSLRKHEAMVEKYINELEMPMTGDWKEDESQWLGFFKGLSYSVVDEKFPEMTLGDRKYEPNRTTVSHNEAYSIYSDVKRAHSVCVRMKTVSTLNILKDAEEGYTNKFNKMVAKIAESKMVAHKIRVKLIDRMGYNFEFLVTDGDVEVHARVIFACGAIKAPHYRFITTERKAS